MILGYQASDSETTCDSFFFGCYVFNPTDRPHNDQETHSALKEKKYGDDLMAILSVSEYKNVT